MELNAERKAQLVGVIKKMKANNEPDERIKQMVTAFQTKHSSGPNFSVGDLGPKTPEQIAQNQQALATKLEAERPAKLAKAQKKMFRDQSIKDQVLAGAGAKAYSGTIGLAKSLAEQAKESGYEDDLLLMGGIDPNTVPEEPKGQTLQDLMGTYDRMSEGSTPARLGEFGADIGMLAIPGAKIAKGIRGTKAALNMAKPTLAALTGGAEGLMSGTAHQLQNIGSGREGSLAEGAIETGLSTVIPYGGSKIAPVLKKKATQIIQTATKLGRKIKGKKVMDANQVQTYFDNYASWRGIKGSEEKISSHAKQLGKKFDNLMNNVSKGTQVNLKAAIRTAKNDVAQKAKSAKINMTDVKSINKTIDEFEGIVTPLMDKTGKIDFKTAQNFKRSTLDPMSKWDKPSPLGTFDPSLQGPAQAARDTRGRLLNRMEVQEPSLAPINKEFGEMAGVRPFIEQAVERQAANRGLSLQDLATLAPGLGMAGGAAYMDKPEYAALGMIPFLLSRGQKSPAIAKTLWEMGNNFGTRSPTRDLIMQGGRSAIFGGGQ